MGLKKRRAGDLFRDLHILRIFFEKLCFVMGAAKGINHACETSVGDSEDGDAGFNGSKQSLYEVLVRACALAIPRVIRNIDDKIRGCAFSNAFSWENDFIANQGAVF